MAEDNEERKAGYGGMSAPSAPEPIGELPRWEDDMADREAGTNTLEGMHENAENTVERVIVEQALTRRQRTKRLNPRRAAENAALDAATREDHARIQRKGTPLNESVVRSRLDSDAKREMRRMDEEEGEKISYADALQRVLTKNREG